MPLEGYWQLPELGRDVTAEKVGKNSMLSRLPFVKSPVTGGIPWV
jgi:hypothetical protein